MLKGTHIEAKLIGAPDLDMNMLAWKASRPNETNPQLADVLKVDAPVNEFSHLTFSLTLPILAREILCSLRDHIVWARTSRVDDLSVWPIWEPAMRHGEAIGRLHAKMKEEKSKGQDQFRMNLPLAYMTQLTVRFSFRTWVKFCASLVLEGEAGGLFGVMCFQLRQAMVNAVSDWSGQINSVIQQDAYGSEVLCPLAELTWNDNAILIGGFVVAEVKNVPIALRAQIVRHRPLAVRDDIRKYFSTEGFAAPISSPVSVETAMTIETAQNLLKKRNCWIAQEDLWRPLIKVLRQAMVGQKVSLPCDGGTCPYVRDNELRLADRDPGPPCPRFAKLTEKPLNYAHTQQARAAAEKRDDRGFWMKELLS